MLMDVVAFLIIAAIAVWIQAYVYKRQIFNNLSYSCSFSVCEAFEGDEVKLVEEVHNNKLLPVHWLKVEIFSSRWLSFADTRSVIAQENRFVTSGYHLGRYQKTTRAWRVLCLKRGIYNTENVTLVGGDLLGLVSRSFPVNVNAKLTVYPGMVDLEETLISSRQLQGDFIIRSWILDDPFTVAGAREYMPGDPMNRIHWQATARTGELMVRNYDYTAHRSIMVLFNVQAREYERGYSNNKPEVERGIKIAATLFDRALKAGVPAGFAANSIFRNNEPVYISPACSELHFTELLACLAGLKLEKAEEFGDWLCSVQLSFEGAEIFIITSYLNEELALKINELKGSCRSIKAIVTGDGIYNGSAAPAFEMFYMKQEGDNNVE